MDQTKPWEGACGRAEQRAGSFVRTVWAHSPPTMLGQGYGEAAEDGGAGACTSSSGHGINWEGWQPCTYHYSVFFGGDSSGCGKGGCTTDMVEGHRHQTLAALRAIGC